MSRISSETLFHFTTKAEYLFKVLENGFVPRYYPEIIDVEGVKKAEYAIPMVCFCDIPLSQIKNHIETYGKYGIGMSSSWAKKSKLNPVIYLENDSQLTNSIVSEIKSISKQRKEQIEKHKAFNIFRYIKKYQGDFKRANKVIKNVKFYDEREWRYVPKVDSKIKFWINETDFKNEILVAESNDNLKEFSLDFDISDIKYVIIKDETEISNMIRSLKRIKSKYNADEIELLISKIITTEQINNDF